MTPKNNDEAITITTRPRVEKRTRAMFGMLAGIGMGQAAFLAAMSSVYSPRPKYGNCETCGNPSRSNPCHKCQTAR